MGAESTAIITRKICSPVCGVVSTNTKKNKKQTYSFTWAKVKTERTEVFTEHTCLSWEQRSDVLPLHDEHIDEVDEDAGSLTGVPGSEC